MKALGLLWVVIGSPFVAPGADTHTAKAPAPLFEVKSRGETYKIAFSPDGKWIAANFQRGVGVWSVATGKLSCTLAHSDGRAFAIAWSPDCRLLAVGTFAGTCRIWNVEQKKSLRLLKHPPSKETYRQVSAAQFHPDGKSIVTGGWDGKVIRWSVATGKKLGSLDVGGKVFSLACSPDAPRIAIGAEAGESIVWDLNGGGTVRTDDVGIQFVHYVAFAEEAGTLIAVGGERHTPTIGRVSFWKIDRKPPARIRSEKLLQPPPARLAGGRLYVLNDRLRWPNIERPHIREIEVWDVSRVRKTAIRRIRDGVLKQDQSRFFSPDARLLAVVEPDRTTIRIWKIADIIRTRTGR